MSTITRGRALLRQYRQEREPAQQAPAERRSRPVELPQMSGSATLSAPVRTDLAAVVAESLGEAAGRAVKEAAARATSLAPARPAPLRPRKPRASAAGRTMVPSALDGHARKTLTASAASVDLEDWYAPSTQLDWIGELHDDEPWEDDAPQGDPLPRVLNPGVELTVFFVGLLLGLAVQGSVAAVAWAALAGGA